MTDKIRDAFDSIHAEDTLKENTMAFLLNEMDKKRKPASFLPIKRLAVACSAVLCVALAGVFSYNLYFSEVAYIDFDVNPSIELAVNRFDRVIGTYAYNEDGTALLDNVVLEHKTYDEAVTLLFDELAQDGYLKSDGLVSVTLQTPDSDLEAQLLPDLTQSVETNLSQHHGPSQAEIYPVSGDVRSAAHNLDLSPAKYLAIMELQEVDATASIESCRDHSITELRGYAQQHGAGHHADTGTGNEGLGGGEMHGGRMHGGGHG